MEQLLLAKSSDFKNDKHSLLRILRALKNRTNETFWQVFSKLIAQVSD